MSALQDAMRATLREVTDEKLLMPITRAALVDPQFKGFQVPVEEWTPRPWDGWFHPSTHATWTARQLFYYLTDPERIEVEQMQLTSIIAITQGKFFHEFLQRLWIQQGVLDQAEVPLVDEHHRRRGHMDGRLISDEGLEIKTMNDFKIGKLTDSDALRTMKPEYYAQTQDYLDMSGLVRMRYFVISTSYPYPMQEFTVDRDEIYQATQRRKYRMAVEAAETRNPPAACCMIRSKQARACVTRACCEIGRNS